VGRGSGWSGAAGGVVRAGRVCRVAGAGVCAEPAGALVSATLSVFGPGPDSECAGAADLRGRTADDDRVRVARGGAAASGVRDGDGAGGLWWRCWGFRCYWGRRSLWLRRRLL
jgi:hypothetical protein